jgi:hypothetical protein
MRTKPWDEYDKNNRKNNKGKKAEKKIEGDIWSKGF